jgi:hypothetical protein
MGWLLGMSGAGEATCWIGRFGCCTGITFGVSSIVGAGSRLGGGGGRSRILMEREVPSRVMGFEPAAFSADSATDLTCDSATEATVGGDFARSWLTRGE